MSPNLPPFRPQKASARQAIFLPFLVLDACRLDGVRADQPQGVIASVGEDRREKGVRVSQGCFVDEEWVETRRRSLLFKRARRAREHNRTF